MKQKAHTKKPERLLKGLFDKFTPAYTASIFPTQRKDLSDKPFFFGGHYFQVQEMV